MEGSLLPTRTSIMKFNTDGKERTHIDMWTEPHSAKMRQRGYWTGRTVFIKKGPDPSANDLIDPATGQPIAPESSENLKLAFSSLRAELVQAQSKDAKLVQVIGLLKKKPLGEFIADALGCLLYTS